MATARDMYKASDDYTDVKCSVCAKQNTDQIADYYCYDCRKHLCTSCIGTHNAFNENHTVVQGLGDSKDVLTERCGKHTDELITLYCRQHNELLCRKCHLLDHRKCQDPKNIRKSAGELNADPELQAVPAQLKSALDNISEAIKALDNYVACIHKNGDGFLKDLEEYAKKLLSRIEELRKKGKANIKRKQEELLSVAKQHRQACVLTKDEIKQCLDKITKSNEWKANMFVLKKKGQTIAQKVDTLCNDSDSLIKKHQFSFQTDIKIFDSFKCFSSLVNEVYTNVQDISSLGAAGGVVQATARRPGDSRIENLEERPLETPEEKPSVGKSPNRSQHVRTIKAHIKKGRFDVYTCRHCPLSDGSLVIADRNNRRLNRVDPSSGTVTQYCDTYEEPSDVCCIGPQDIAVANCSTKVLVYNAFSLTRTRSIELGHKTCMIACHGGQLYCAGPCDNTLYVNDISSGRKLREIRKDTYGRNLWNLFYKPDLFYNINSIAVNGSGDRVFVTDWDGGLTCINTDGQLIFRLSKKDLGLGEYDEASEVTTDHRGHVFVCGSYSVVKVTENGHLVGEILSRKDGIEYPKSLSYDVNRSRLYVGVMSSDQLFMVDLK